MASVLDPSNFPPLLSNLMRNSAIGNQFIPPMVSNVQMGHRFGGNPKFGGEIVPPLLSTVQNSNGSGTNAISVRGGGGVTRDSDVGMGGVLTANSGVDFETTTPGGLGGTPAIQNQQPGVGLYGEKSRPDHPNRPDSTRNRETDRVFVPPKRLYANVANGSPGAHEITPPSPRASRKLFSKMESSALVKPRAPIIHKGKLAIRFSHEEIDTLALSYKFSLVAKVINGWIDLARFRTSFARLGLTSHYTIRAMRVGYFHIHCSIEEDFNRLLIKSEFLFAGASVKMFRWTPYFDFEAEPSVVPVWVNFWNYHVHMLDLGPLLSFAAALGNPIALDEATVKRTRPNHARVCIEIDLEKERNYELTELVDDWESTFHVEYENLPPYCPKCRVLGHVVGDCGKKRVVIRPKKYTRVEGEATKAPTTEAPKRAAPKSQAKKTGEWIEVGRKNRSRRTNEKKQNLPDPNAMDGNDGLGPKQHYLEANGSGQAAGSAREKAGENAGEKESAEENAYRRKKSANWIL